METEKTKAPDGTGDEKKVKECYRIRVGNHLSEHNVPEPFNKYYFDFEEAIEAFLRCIEYFEKDDLYLYHPKVLKAIGSNVEWALDKGYYFTVELKRYSFLQQEDDEPISLKELKQMSEHDLSFYLKSYKPQEIPGKYVEILEQKTDQTWVDFDGIWLNSNPFVYDPDGKINLNDDDEDD